MKAIILNGSNKDDADMLNIQSVIYDELNSIGWESESFILHEMKIVSCMGDFGCWIKTPGVCIIKDEGHDIARAFINSDMVVLLSPISFGGYSAELKKALDRIICLISPFFMKISGEFHHKKRYSRYPALTAVGVLDKADDESRQIFEKLVNRNAVNFHAPASATEIILRNQDAENIRAKIQRLFLKAEVKQ